VFKQTKIDSKGIAIVYKANSYLLRIMRALCTHYAHELHASCTQAARAQKAYTTIGKNEECRVMRNMPRWRWLAVDPY
jgi:hypothetical protein